MDINIKFSKLDSINRKIIWFCYYHPISLRELSRKLKLHPSTVEDRIHKINKIKKGMIKKVEKGNKKYMITEGFEERQVELIIEKTIEILEKAKKKPLSEKEIFDMIHNEIHYVKFPDGSLLEVNSGITQKVKENVFETPLLLTKKYFLSSFGKDYIKIHKSKLKKITSS